MINMAQRAGLLDRVARYPVSDGITIGVPLYRPDNQWDAKDVAGYEAGLLAMLAEEVAKLPRPVTLVDCGADIGLISVLLAAKCRCLDRVIAFEPNPEAYDVLASNIGRLPVKAEARREAVSDFVGLGELKAPAYDASAHGRFLAPASNGTIAVTRVDDLGIGGEGSVCLKIDVEGGETGVLRGSLETLRRARGFVVTVEANRDVVTRTGIDPMECVRLLRSVRECDVRVAEAPTKVLVDEDGVGFFQQFNTRRVYNLVCRSV